MRRERGVRTVVEDGSKPVREGVRRALRFCVMLSSIAEREIRRKSGFRDVSTSFYRYIEIRLPLRAKVLKQNCGVNSGTFGACAMISYVAAFGDCSTREGRDQKY